MWMTRIYTCVKPDGRKVIEKSRFYVPSNVKPRSGRKAATTERKQDANDRDYVKRLARSINCNFGKGDFLVTLEYCDEAYAELIETCAGDDAEELEAAIYQAAKSCVEKIIRKARDILKREEISLAYICMTSQKNPDTGDSVRVHHHLLMPKECVGAMSALWEYGICNLTPLRGQEDYTPIAEYFAAQAPKVKDAKKHTASRNLLKPHIRETVDEVRRELRAPAGSKLIYKSAYVPDVEGFANTAQYIKYIPKKRRKKEETPTLEGD
jgi:hypothetical protein